jgi:hypothetical protein
MLFFKVSENRIFMVSEYWIIIPVVLTIDFIILKKIKKRYDRKVELDKLKKLKIFHLAAGDIPNLIALSYIRGGQICTELINQEIEVRVSNCLVRKGLQYLNNSKLRDYIIRHFKKKAKNGIIFITKSALCYLIQTERTAITSSIIFQLANVSIGVSDTRVLLLKIISAVVGVGIPLPMGIVACLYAGPTRFVTGMITIVSLMIGAVVHSYIDEDLLDGELITSSFKLIKPREPNQIEVVSVNLVPERIDKVKFPSECSLPEQLVLNPKCAKDMVRMPDNVHDVVLNYKDVVNLQDVTNLDAKFTDQQEIIAPFKADVEEFLLEPRPVEKIPPRKRGKMVNFLDKFKDPQDIPTSEQWDSGVNNFKTFKENIQLLIDDGDIL